MTILMLSLTIEWWVRLSNSLAKLRVSGGCGGFSYLLLFYFHSIAIDSI